MYLILVAVGIIPILEVLQSVQIVTISFISANKVDYQTIKGSNIYIATFFAISILAELHIVCTIIVINNINYFGNESVL